jgi:hypothetical protein
MNRRSSLPLFVLSILSLATPAYADVLAGKICEASCDRFRTISIFGDTMNGNTEPLSLLGGPAQSGMLDASAMVYDPGEKTVLVADFYGQSIHVFPAAARGDVAPLRSFSSAHMGQPRNIVRVSGQDEYIALSASFLLAFPRTATGSQFPLRMTTYAPTVIGNASGLAYLPASDEVAVGDYEDLGPNLYGGEVLIFPRTISGTPVPSRRIAGPLTQLGSFVNSLAVDTAHNELFVLVTDADSRSRIVVFPTSADGNVAPLRVIGGDNTRMTNASGLDYYAFRDELLVASGTYNSATTQVLGFARTAQGNIAPSRDISGSNTGVSAASGWLAVVGVPLAQVFGDGFE